MSRPTDPQQAIVRVTLPHCKHCGKGDPRVYSIGEGNNIWLCVTCEYRITYPQAAEAILPPRTMRSLRLQTERLFEV